MRLIGLADSHSPTIGRYLVCGPGDFERAFRHGDARARQSEANTLVTGIKRS
jgi:hypothetical protein